TGPAPDNSKSLERKRQHLARNMTAIRTKWRQASKPDTRMLSTIKAELSSAGWTVVTCSGEADVYVALLERADAGDGGITVVTTDSDMLFHNISTVIRQDPVSKSKFWSFEVPKVRRELDISEEAWTLCAVLSENDYTGAGTQEPTRMISDVFESLWSLEHGGVHRVASADASDQTMQLSAVHTPMSTVELLSAYCAQLGTVQASYKAAFDIFVDLNETPAQEPTQAPSNLDSLVISAIQQFSSVFT
ncbi:hypothetical protein BGZ68_004121, partial [Mortierella alpina]